ncbi:unnamed protein product [Lactuca saligna]|uniref:Uncharacterized protein n=1 Tax=Lactuca saligna TaxID=75948 RepID=A0AA35ZA91_LACSI|nr:unnamed protein product [Lactuca saligna]
MAAISGGSSSSNSNASSSAFSHQAPKILLAKPTLVITAKYNREPGDGGGGGDPDDDSSSLRSCLPSIGFLNLLSDSWDFHTDRFLPGIGKSTIMNEIYGFDATSPGSLAFFPFFIYIYTHICDFN